MSAAWTVILAIAAGTILIKAAGPLLVGARRPPDRALGVIALTAPALLASLVVYETFGVRGKGAQIDARLVGVLVAVAALRLRAPITVVIGVAALATALTRLVF